MKTEQRERYEADLSAIADGELDGEPLRRAIDALVRDRDLRQFWADMRLMQMGLGEVAGETAGISPPEGLWDAIESKAKSNRVFALKVVPVRAWAAAATVLLAVGLTISGFLKVDIPFFHNPERTIQLASDRGSMTEGRFIELTTELLKADPRYQRKMLEVMQVVNQQAYGFETGETSPRRGEPLRDNRLASGETLDAQAPASSRNDVELTLW